MFSNGFLNFTVKTGCAVLYHWLDICFMVHTLLIPYVQRRKEEEFIVLRYCLYGCFNIWHPAPHSSGHICVMAMYNCTLQ